MRLAPERFWNSGISMETASEGRTTESGFRNRRLPSSRSVFCRARGYACTRASGSPMYHASSSRQTTRTSTSRRRVPWHSWTRSSFSWRQSALSRSLITTKRTPGSRQAFNLRGMLFSRSCFPSCGMHRNGSPGKSLGSNPSRSIFIESSSNRNTIRFTRVQPPRKAPASKEPPANLPLRQAFQADRCRTPGARS